jgi:hypothetical protein
MEVLHLSISKRRINNSSSSSYAKLHGRSVDNSWGSLDRLRLSSCYNMRISIDEIAASPAVEGGAQAISP